jgi:hypothetical protein
MHFNVRCNKFNLLMTEMGHEPNRSRMPVCQLSSAGADMPSDEAMDEKCHEPTLRRLLDFTAREALHAPSLGSSVLIQTAVGTGTTEVSVRANGG